MEREDAQSELLSLFLCVCYILNDKDHLNKFDSRNDVGMFWGYATHSMAFSIYNQKTKMIVESINVVFDDKNNLSLDEVTLEEEHVTYCDQSVKSKTQSNKENEDEKTF